MLLFLSLENIKLLSIEYSYPTDSFLAIVEIGRYRETIILYDKKKPYSWRPKVLLGRYFINYN